MEIQCVSGQLPLASRIPNGGLTDAWVTMRGELLFEVWAFIVRLPITIEEEHVLIIYAIGSTYYRYLGAPPPILQSASV